MQELVSFHRIRKRWSSEMNEPHLQIFTKAAQTLSANIFEYSISTGIEGLMTQPTAGRRNQDPDVHLILDFHWCQRK